MDLVNTDMMDKWRVLGRKLKEHDLQITDEELRGGDKIETAENIIKEALRVSTNPVVFCSFGKDSTTLLHMVQKYRPDVEVIYLMGSSMISKSLYAFKMASKMDVQLHTYPPTSVDYVQKDDYFEVFHYYYINGADWHCRYNGVDKYKKDEKFLCAAKDMLNIPTVPSYTFQWDCIFHGQKETESVHIIDKYKIKTPIIPYGHGVMAMPLFNWSDDDVWAYIESNGLPFQKSRYKNNPSGEATGDKRDKYSSDVVPTCFDCFDYRNEGKEIICPKSGNPMPFQGKSKEQHDEFMGLLTKKIRYIEEVTEDNRFGGMKNADSLS